MVRTHFIVGSKTHWTGLLGLKQYTVKKRKKKILDEIEEDFNR